ncbi:MAG: FecR family protein, partial [Elusimicrobia bacterium]|nr:FecR family protein [Elusimicrobiota bacterium]
MRKTIFAGIFAVALAVFASDAWAAVVLSVGGKVEVRPAGQTEWVLAQPGVEITQGASVRTGPDGRAVIVFGGKKESRLWMKESSTLDIEKEDSLFKRLSLVLGNIKLRVFRKGKETFEIKTPAAICAVRGTDFTVLFDENGKFRAETLYGLIKTTPLADGKEGAAKKIAQGIAYLIENGKTSFPPLTQDEIKEALKDWDPGLTEEQRMALLNMKDDDRRQMRLFAQRSGQTEQDIQNLLTQIRESDISAGRTLNDVHGNLVRVDQLMLRPDAKTIQFLNLVKRPDYKYRLPAGTGEFAYNGGAVKSRLDALQARVTFNKALPQNLSAWPGFFADTSNLH